MDRTGINCIDYATLTAASTGVSTLKDASPSITAGVEVHRAFITCEDYDIRWRADGTNPTTSEGHLLEVGDAMPLMNASYQSFLLKWTCIATAGTAHVKITYFD